MNQKDIVYKIVKEAGSLGIRTEQVKIEAMRRGISCADRYLRWLAEENKVDSQRKPDDKTHTWWVKKPGPKQQSFLNPVHQGIIDNLTLKPLIKDILG